MKRGKRKMRNRLVSIALLLLPAAVVAGNLAKGVYDNIDKKEEREINKELKEIEKKGIPPWSDAVLSDDEIAKYAITYDYYYMKEYVKVLDASIAYLEQVLRDGNGDVRLANEQTKKMMELSSKMTEAVFGDRNLSRKDAARVIKMMADKNNTSTKEYYRLQLIDKIEEKGFFKVKKGVSGEQEKSVAREKTRDSGNSGKAAAPIDTSDPEKLDIVKLLGPDPEMDKATAKQLSKDFGPD